MKSENCSKIFDCCFFDLELLLIEFKVLIVSFVTDTANMKAPIPRVVKLETTEKEYAKAIYCKFTATK